MFQEIWPDNFVIHDDTSIIFDRSHTPDEECAFNKPIERYDFCDVKWEEFKGWERSENHPVIKDEEIRRNYSSLNKNCLTIVFISQKIAYIYLWIVGV